MVLTLVRCQIIDGASLKAGKKTNLDILLEVEPSCQEREENKRFLVERACDTAVLGVVVVCACLCVCVCVCVDQVFL